MSLRRILIVAAVVAVAVLLWRTPKETPDTAPRGLGSISVSEGFLVQPAATPGLVKYPMLGAIAPDGVIYMCESSGRTMKTPEMTASPDYVVSRLVDSDGDGVYDKSTVFADKLTLPAGAAWYRGSLYVAAPPYVYRFQDTNGDGAADVREVIVEGWNLSANAASLHGPILGPDGWLYLTDGRHGFDIRTKDGREYKGKASRIWRLRPDGTGLEPFAGGGFDNPVEVAFTDGGDMFGTMTYFTDPQDGQRDAILHFVEGGVYPKPHPAMEELVRTGDLMPVMTKFARIAPAGLLRYRGGNFGPEYQNDLFTAQFNSHRIQRHVVSRHGSTYQTQDSDFFVSSDPDVHPTDVMEDADGSLIVVDTGAWFIHGCPLSKSPKPEITGTLYRVRRVAAERLADPRGERIREWKASLLDDPRPFVRDRAVEQLVAAGDTHVAELAVMRAEAATPAGATGAVFALARIGSPAAREELRAALKDRRWQARQAAARMAGMLGDKEAVPQLIAMLAKEDPAVRRQAATALGAIGDPAAVDALLTAAADPEDRFVEHALIYALIRLGDSRALLTRLNDPNAGVRKAALIALDQIPKSPLTDRLVMPLLADSDAGLRKAAFWVVSRRPAWAARLSQAVEARVRAAEIPEAEANVLRDTIGAFCGDSRMAAAMAKALGDPQLDAARQMFLIEAAEGCSSPGLPAQWNAGLTRLLEHSDVAVRLRAIGLVRTRGVTGLDGQLRQLADAAAQPDEVRLMALGVLSSRQPMSDSDLAYLTSRTLPSADASTKLAAGQVLARASLSAGQLTELARRHLRAADPLVLPNLLDAFRASKEEPVGLALVKALDGMEDSLGTAGSQRVNEVVAAYPQAVADAAKPLIEKIARQREGRLAKLAALAPVLTRQGNVASGREIFFGAKAGCSSCHTMGSAGGHVGPDLTSIGAIRSGRDLLEAIILPSESYVPGHEVYRVETVRDVYSGILGRNSPPGVIRLVTGPGDEVLIPRKEVLKMGHAPVSLMPEGYEEVLTQVELADLLAYLRGQTSRAAAGGTD